MGLYNKIRHKMRFKLLFVYFFVSVIPIIVIQLSLFKLYSNSMETKVEELLEYNLQNIKNNIEEVLNTYQNLVYIINADTEFQDLVEKINAEDKAELAITKQNMREFLMRYIHMRKDLRSLTIINNRKEVFQYDRRENRLKSTMNDPLADTLYSEGIKGSSILFFDNEANNNDLFYMVFPVRHLRSKQTMGTLVVGIQKKAINTIFDYNIQSKSIDSHYYVINDTLDIIFYSDLTEDTWIGDDLNSRDYIIKSVDVSTYKWKVITAVKRKSILKEVNTMKFLTFSITCFIILLTTIIILFFVQSLTGAIGKIVKGFKKVQQGELSTSIQLESKDELKMIENNFNEMVQRLKEQRDEIIELSYTQKEAEIRALEAQINPHFIYNTINCINWMAIDKEVYEISKALKYLAEIMRYSVSNSNIITPLKEEINWLEQYIYLQKMRFKNRFNCVIDIDEKAMDFPIYKLLIQPLIENAIIHGMEDVKSNGIITVKAYVIEEGRLKLVIGDNGKGMEKSILDKVKNSIQSNHIGEKDKESIGIFNVIERIKIYYGNSGKIDIRSDSRGTCIEIVIPKVIKGRAINESDCH